MKTLLFDVKTKIMTYFEKENYGGLYKRGISFTFCNINKDLKNGTEKWQQSQDSIRFWPFEPR